MVELAANLRATRESAGVSLAAMSRRTHYSKALLGHLETGTRAIHPEHVAAYSHALDVAVVELYASAHDPVRRAHEWLVSETPTLRHTSQGRRVGASLADELEQRVVALRHLDDVVSGGDLYPAVQQELAEAWQLLETASYSTDTARRLLTVTGELSQLAGWVSSDAGYYRHAQQTYLAGVSAAQEAGDHTLVGQLLSSLAYQVANVGDPASAELLARSAAKGAKEAPPVARALLLERVAWASARARNEDGARRALEQVDDVYAGRSRDIEEPEWVYWLDRTEIDVMAGRVLIELGRPAQAEPLLVAAIADYNTDHAREVALYRTWLAEAYVRSGDLDAARLIVREAEGAAHTLASARLDRRVAEVAGVLEGAAPH